MTISRRSFARSILAAVAGATVLRQAVAAPVKEQIAEAFGVPVESVPEGPRTIAEKEFHPAAIQPRQTLSLLRDIGYNGHPDIVATCRVSRRELEDGAFDTERYVIARLDRILERYDGDRADGILYRVLPETTRWHGPCPGDVSFSRHARAVGERKTVKRVVFDKDGCEVAVDMTVEYDSTVGEGEITVSCKASHDLMLSSPYHVREIIDRGVRLQLIAEARERWGMASTMTFMGPERDSHDFWTFSQSIRKVTLPAYCFGFPTTVEIATQLRAYNYACKVNAENGVPR